MLTKELLPFKMRKEKLFPLFLNTEDPASRELVSQYCQVLEANQGASRVHLEEELDFVTQGAQIPVKVANGIRKILEKFLIFETLDRPGFREARLELFALAALKRKDRTGIAFDKVEYRKQLCAEMSGPLAQSVDHKIYADLPSEDRFLSVPNISSERVLQQYNLSIVQGLLLSSVSLRLSVFDRDVSVLRRLFGYMKFFGVTAAVESANESPLVLNLDGPLSVLEHARSYGFQLACFFPAVLQLSNWKLEAQVKLKLAGRISSGGLLELGPSDGLVGHFDNRVAHRPEELRKFMESFHAVAGEWQAAECAQLVQLEDGEYCFPDFVFHTKSSPNALVYLEVFHPWHRGPLLRRLKSRAQVSGSKIQGVGGGKLLLAIDKKLLKEALKDKGSEGQITNACKSSDQRVVGDPLVMVFSQFLQAKKVRKELDLC